MQPPSAALFPKLPAGSCDRPHSSNAVGSRLVISVSDDRNPGMSPHVALGQLAANEGLHSSDRVAAPKLYTTFHGAGVLRVL